MNSTQKESFSKNILIDQSKKKKDGAASIKMKFNQNQFKSKKKN